ncbi:hypothetical protein DH09_04780 [Bacillaceae bacterium JMAK1]|nr:hypothetical protein DH09_04780 [Bacillaceae bacterium JMAK1]
MIPLTRLDGQLFYLQIVHIVTVEELPDTTLTLVGNRKHVVRESLDDVNEAIEAKLMMYGVAAASKQEEDA